jgi:glycosyltransferase involved in cell wall biosynthesis
MVEGEAPFRIAHVQPMTLDLFGHEDRDFGTSANYFLPNLARAQDAAGHDVSIHLLTSSASHSTSLGRIKVHFHRCLQPPAIAGTHRRFGRQLSARMLSKLVRPAPQVVHFHGARNCQLMFAGVAAHTTRNRIPLVAHEQGARDGLALENWSFKYAVRHVGALIAGNSESEQAFRREVDKLPPVAVHTIPNGYDPTFFYPDPIARQRDPDRLRVLVVSRLSAEKDPLTAADAVRKLADHGHEVEVTVIGAGPLRAQMEERIRAGTDHLRVLDPVPQSHLRDHYRAADVLLLTSLGEGSNQTVVEAMACGLPVIATDVRGIRDVVADAGILVPARDSEAATSALQRTIAERTLLPTMREAGLLRAKPLTWQAIAERLDRVYEDVLRVAG